MTARKPAAKPAKAKPVAKRKAAKPRRARVASPPPKSSTSKTPAKPGKPARATPKAAKSSTSRPRRKPAAKPAAPKTGARTAKAHPKMDLAALGATVVSLSAKTVLIEMPIKTATDLFPEPLEESGPSRTIEGVERELKVIRKRDPALADSALAGSAYALARAVDSPQTSATAKAACGKEMRETLARLAALAPEEAKKGRLHDIRSGRADRLAAGGAAGKD